MARKPLSRESIDSLYRRYDANAADAHDILEAIEERAQLASSLFVLEAAQMSQADLDDAFGRLSAAAVDRHPNEDSIEEVVRMTSARVQLTAIQREQERRVDIFGAATRGEVYLPTRPELVGSLIGFGAQLERGDDTHFRATFDRIVSSVRQGLNEQSPGAPVVIHALRTANTLPTEDPASPLDSWMRWAIVLELLADKNGYGGIRISVDDVTRSAAIRAKRLLYAIDRQDPRYDEADWPLDLPGDALANLLEEHYFAAQEWARLGAPDRDLRRLLAPVRWEERERPEPHPQIFYEKEAQDFAVRGGAFPYPLVYPIPPAERARLARQIWAHGLPRIASGKVGLVFNPAAGDPRVRWGAPPYPYGLLCAVRLSPNEVLNVARPGYDDDHERFNQLTRRASHMATSDADYPDTLRNVLLSEGYKAVAIYNEIHGFMHELVLLDTAPNVVVVIRESVPAFVQGDRPLELPRRNRGIIRPLFNAHP